MRKSVRRKLFRLAPARLLVAWLALVRGKRARIFQAHGWARSVRVLLPIDEHGEPVPYIPYCATALLRERLSPDLSVLEFGAGHSTLFFMKRVGHLTALEHHADWVKTLRSRVTGNVELIAVPADPPDAYGAPALESAKTYDVIVVDGRHRTVCFDMALQRITARGVVLLDDSDRPAYAGIFERARAAGFRALTLEGHKPASLNLHRSTFFYRDGNCLNL
jgi:hypothetical protein